MFPAHVLVLARLSRVPPQQRVVVRAGEARDFATNNSEDFNCAQAGNEQAELPGPGR